jgi:hypothetical protein
MGAGQSVWISAFTVRTAAWHVELMLYLAEFYLPASASLAGIVGRARAGAAGAARVGAEIHFIQAVFVRDDEICYALYQAGSVADLDAARSLAGLEFDRVGEAQAVLT